MRTSSAYSGGCRYLAAAARLLLLAASLLFRAEAGSIDDAFGPLPHNEREAARMLRDGTLDSAAWLQFKPYYNQPIEVPLGEARLLSELAPWIQRPLPVTKAQLAAYEPWDRQSIRRFFSDFPEIEVFRPILSFAWTPIAHAGAIGVDCRDAYGDPRPAVTLSFGNRRTVTMNGRGLFERDFARWQRRQLTVHSGRAGDVSIGNFPAPVRNALLLGWFPHYADSLQSVSDNWMFGSADGWNGACWSIDHHDRFAAGIFGHARALESAAGVFGSLRVAPPLWVDAGAWALSASDYGVRDTAYTGEIAIRAARGSAHLDVRAGLTSQCPSSIPVRASLGFGGPAHAVRLEIMRLPRGLVAPRSRAWYDCARRLDVPMDTVRESLLSMALAAEHRLGRAFCLAPEVSLIHTPSRASCDLSLECRNTGTVGWRARLMYHPSITDSVAHARLSGELAIPWRSGLECRFTASAYGDNTGRRTGNLGAQAQWEIGPRLSITPRVAGYWGAGDTPWFTAGIEQSLMLFERTRCGFAVSAPVAPRTGDEPPEVNAYALFYF